MALGVDEVVFPIELKNGPDLINPKDLAKYLESGCPVSVHILSIPPAKDLGSNPTSWIDEIKNEGVSIRWSTSALLSYHIHLYSQEHGIKPAVSAVAQHAGIDGSTLSNLLRKPQGFMSRTWLKFRNALGISASDEQSITDLKLLGLPPDTVQELKTDIKKLIAVLLNTEFQQLETEANGKKLIGSQVMDLFMTVHPEFCDNADTRLATLIYETLDDLGIEDPRRSLIEEIAEIGITLKHVHDSTIVKAMRHQKIGDMTEQLTDLALQLSGERTVSEYVLTSVRDGLGTVRKASDIIDFVSFDTDRVDFLRRAHFEKEMKRGAKIEKLKGVILIMKDPENEEQKPWLDDQLSARLITSSPDALSCHYAEYKVEGQEGTASVTHYEYNRHR